MPVSHLSPWFLAPSALLFALLALFLLAVTPSLWRYEPGQPQQTVGVCRTAAVFCAVAGCWCAFIAVASAYSALYGWGVL